MPRPLRYGFAYSAMHDRPNTVRTSRSASGTWPAWLLLACFALALAGCSLPQLAYNNADTLLRFKGNDYFEPTYQQGLLLNTAIIRVHAWHRQQELPRYGSAFEGMAQRVERGLGADDVEWLRDFLRARYRTLAGRAFDEALPALRTLTPDNLAALERQFAERNEEYADEFLSGDRAGRERVQRDHLREHFERWTGSLDAAQVALIADFVAGHPRFAALRLENRMHLQREGLAILERMMAGDPQADAALRDLVVDWEKHATPAYRAALREWELGMIRLVLKLDRSLRADQRTETARILRDYAGVMHALANRTATPDARTASR